MSRSSEPEKLRDHHAVATRRTVLTAARHLFGRQGYGDTSVRELAQEAGVAVQTVYAHFGSKVGVVVALNDLLDEEAGIPEIAPLIMQSQDPHEILRLLARMQRQIWERCSDIVRIGRQGALSGDEGSALWKRGQGSHRAGMARIAGRLAEIGALRPGLSAGDAGVELSSISNVDTFENYVDHGGRTFDELEDWLYVQFTGVLDPGRRDAPAPS